MNSIVPFAGMWLFTTVVLGALTVVIHLVFAVGVWRDASDRERMNLGLAFAPASVWGLATLLGGVFVAGVYWLMHHSTLRAGYRVEKPQEYAEPLA